MKNLFVLLYNKMSRFRRTRVAPGELLLLLPHCLQWKDCPQNIIQDLNHCRECGKCKIGDLKQMGEKYGVRVMIASGGRQAAQAVKDPAVKAVVSVACNKELREGLRAVFPKPVIAIHNTLPFGACVNTQVELAQVEEAIHHFLEKANAKR